MHLKLHVYTTFFYHTAVTTEQSPDGAKKKRQHSPLSLGGYCTYDGTKPRWGKKKLTAFPPVVRGGTALRTEQSPDGAKKKLTAFPPVVRGGTALTTE